MDHERDKKGKLVMIPKIVLILIMSATLAGASVTSTPFPVLLAIACLIIVALSVAMRGEQQR